MITDIADNHPNDDKRTFSTWPRSRGNQEKFGIFFSEGTNARETLRRMLIPNLEELNITMESNNYQKLKNFKSWKLLFLDILDLFN